MFITFGTKLYRQIIGIPMGTNCAPLVADLFLFCYDRDFMTSLSPENQTDIIEAFNSTLRYRFFLLQCSSGVVRHPRDLQVSVATHFCRVLVFASS